ncbi:hypothetical protein [Streptomyces vinaceus]|uniref:hypothetical protein n=1 Tax=Streptomyces vinaceus TaxID=1960 RepID=UPI0038114622
MSTPTPSTADGDGQMRPELSLIKGSMRRGTKMSISKGAVVAAGAVVRLILSEIIAGAQGVAARERKEEITPKHIKCAFASDAELASIGHYWLVGSGGTAGSAERPESRAAAPEEREARVEELGESSDSTDAHQYGTTIERLLRTKGCRASSEGFSVLDSLANQLVEGLAGEAAMLATRAGKQTLGLNDIEGSIELLLKGELQMLAFAEVREELSQEAQRTAAGQEDPTDAAAEEAQ